MRTFLVNLLPQEIGARLRSHGEKRRVLLLVMLLGFSLVGVSLHSWDQVRRARAVRDAVVMSRDGANETEAELARLEAERQRLAAYMETYRSIALPMELTDLVATAVNLLPAKATLTDVAVKLEFRAQPSPASAGPAAPGAPPPPPPPPPKRVLEVRLRGYAQGSAEVTAFERALASTPPFTRVILGENRSLETPEGNFQEFVLTAEIPLDRAYNLAPDSGPLALDDDAAPTREAAPTLDAARVEATDARRASLEVKP